MQLNRSPKGGATSPVPKEALSSSAPKRGPSVRASGEGMKLGFLRPGQRSSVKTSKSELAAASTSTAAASATSPVSPTSKDSPPSKGDAPVPPLSMSGEKHSVEPLQKSPKNKRFSMVREK